jgi:hypothetical protein
MRVPRPDESRARNRAIGTGMSAHEAGGEVAPTAGVM